MLRTVLFVTLNFPTILSAIYLRGPRVLVDVTLESLESWFRLDSKIPELILLSISVHQIRTCVHNIQKNVEIMILDSRIST